MDHDAFPLGAYVIESLSKAERFAYARLTCDLKVTVCSSNFASLLMLDVENVLGTAVTDLCFEFIGFEKLLAEVTANERDTVQIEKVHRKTQQGKTIYLDFTVSRLIDNHPEQGLLFLIEDVTKTAVLQQSLTQERNELRLLREKLTRANNELNHINQLKSLFLSIAAHDLRAPLSVITGYVGLIEMMIQNNPKIDRYLNLISIQSNRINQQITNLLDLDSIDRGVLEILLDDCDLLEILDELSQTLPITYQNRNIALSTDLPINPIIIPLDKEKIARVLYNVLGNAYKYTPDNGEIYIQAKVENEFAIISIKDNGTGMSEDELENLFQPYFRTQDALASDVKGNGLGLYIVKMLVEAHNGSVSVSSAIGKGTIFTIQLPLFHTPSG